MLAFAYSECGLSVDEFFDLSFYEWSLEIYKVRKRKEIEYSKWEWDASLTRELMAAVYNTAGKSFKKQFDGKEFIKLSFDTVESNQELKETREMTQQEIQSKFGKNLKR